MLTLLVLRHAKAVPQGGDDFARALTGKGQADARRTGVFLQAHQLSPQLALVSSAARTRETFETIAGCFPEPIAAELDEGLYNAGCEDLRARIASIGGEVKTLLVTGHNPGIMELAIKLSRDGDPRDLDVMRSRFPPASLAVIEFNGDDWADAAARGGHLVDFVTPEILIARG
jgi:phosphohistidine phosphatase